MNGILILFCCILLSAAASFFLKLAATSLGSKPDIPTFLFNRNIWIGGGFYALAFLGYIWALRIVPLSLAQPAITAGVSALTALVALLVLDESITLVNWIGLSFICLGVVFLFWGRA